MKEKQMRQYYKIEHYMYYVWQLILVEISV